MIDTSLMKEALLIRRVEETFLELFSQGKLNGTVHTCVGQEFSAVAFAGQLEKDDFIFSNHRCHGHYIAYTKDCHGLIAELMGKEAGICGGVGSSQHLCRDNFFSNGIQGGIVPVAAGFALANKLKNNNRMGIVFIGDGTLGQGVVYETMNIVSKWNIPLLIVCENNFYAQSTPQHINLAGDILKRPEAFAIKTFRNTTQNVDELIKDAKESIDYVRNHLKPAFFLVETYRLNPHSKGDDDRDKEEISKYRDIDPLNVFEKENPKQYEKILEHINEQIRTILEDIEDKPELSLGKYFEVQKKKQQIEWEPVEEINTRQVDLINQFFVQTMADDKSVVFMGEDILEPYGGAFKTAKTLSEKYPEQVFSTPISEAAITGIANGLALGGMKPFLEIMFGDFITLSFDQIVNHASKFYHMYNKQVTCPVVIRTPMGGRRGYGPTHSQTLDKFVSGIDNVKTVALNTLTDPRKIYEVIYRKEKHPVIVIENKTDYGKKITKKQIKNYKYEQTTGDYPVVKISPVISEPTATIVTYGAMTGIVLNCVDELFTELDLKTEVIVLTMIHPIEYEPIFESVRKTGKLFVAEEGSSFAGIGSEIISSVTEALKENIIARRIASLPVPIPSVRSLEDKVLPSSSSIFETVKQILS
ncbi:MAG: pyruvate dehydrogenase [Desulfobacteraceae bacterium]|nr:pyruvate dehydrogenase [Desulfobacteraceae bacterium]